MSTEPPGPSLPLLEPSQPYLPAAYRLPFPGATRGLQVAWRPQVALIELTGSDLAGVQPPMLALPEFAQVLGQLGHVGRAILMGVGDPLLNPDLIEMVGLLKLRDVHVIVDSTCVAPMGALATELVRSGVDEFRCELVGVRGETYERLAGKNRLVTAITAIEALQSAKTRHASQLPRIVLRCAAHRETLQELPALIRLAARLGAAEVYVQRWVYPLAESEGFSSAVASRNGAIFGREPSNIDEVLSECEALAVELSIDLRAAGGRDPRNSLAAAVFAQSAPWQACLRPWTSVYINSNGDCLPCRIAPQAAPGLKRANLGNLLRQTFAEIWNGHRYQDFRRALLSNSPGVPCAGCGVCWSL